MKNLYHSSFSRPTLTLTISATVSLVLLFVLLTGNDALRVHAQTGDTPTPVPTIEQPDGPGSWQLPPIEGKLHSPQYPNMDSSLNRIVLQVETGQSIAQAAAANAPLHQEESVAVTL